MLKFYLEIYAKMDMKSTVSADNSRSAALREKYIVWVALLITAITYAGTLRFDFVFDDYGQILFNPFIKAWRYVPQYFSSGVWTHLSPSSPGNYYRPLFLLLLRVNYSMFADRPMGWHLAAVALHLLVTWLTFVLVKKLTGEFSVAWLAALIFGVHPVHHEVVAWISGMTESLFAVLFLVSFLAYLQSLVSSRKIWMGVSCSFYALAMLSKETAIVLPALVFAHSWIGKDPAGGEERSGNFDRFKKALRPALWYLPIAFVYLVVRYRVLSGMGHSLSDASFSTWIVTMPSILLVYIKNWFFPVRLAESYDLSYQSNFSVLHVLVPGLIVLAVCAAVWFLRARLGNRDVGFAAAWIVISLLPALDTFVFKPDELVHDRYFYVPSIGAAFLIALIVVRAAKTRVGVFGQPVHVVATGLALALVLALLATSAASFWVGNYALFSRAHEVAPRNTTAASSLAAEMIARQEVDAAQVLLENAYRQNGNDYGIDYNLGRVEYAKHQYAKAEEYARKAISLVPNFSDGYISLGAIELRQGRTAEAQENLRRAVEVGPYSAPAHTSYGVVLALKGDCVGASQQFESSLALNPGDPVTQIQLLRCRAALGAGAPPATKPGQL